MRRNQKRKLSNFAAGLLALVLMVVVTYLGFTKAIPFQHHFTIHAAFTSANNMRKNSFVRIAGVNVGKVTGVHQLKTAGGHGGALVDMRIDDVGMPLHTDASAAIRPRIFLEGNFFVDLSPGSPSAPTMHDGDTLPVQNDTSPVQLDQILTSLQAGTRGNLQTLIKEYAKGLSAGGAAGFNRSIPYWTPGLPRLLDRQRRHPGHEPRRPGGLHQGRRHHRRGAGPQPARAAGPDHRLQHDGARLRRAAGGA